MKQFFIYAFYHISILKKHLLPLLFILSIIFSGLVSQNASADETSADASISISIIGTPQNEVAEETSEDARILTSIIVTPQNALAEETSADTSCCECHNDICEVDLNKTKVHLPFLKQQCSFCHVYDDTAVEEKTDDTAVVEEKYNSSTKNITWLDYRVSFASEHWFIIPIEQLSNDKLIVCAHDIMGKSHEEILSLPAFDALPLKINDNKPPDIKSADLIGVYQSVLISARINWITDKESDSEIRYGIDTLQSSVKADNFTTDHEIVLQGLQPDQKYQYMVISRDVFGNKTESGITLLSTEKLSPYPPKESEEYPKIDIRLAAQFFRNGDSYLVKFTANHPVILSVGSSTVNEEEKKVPEGVLANIPDHLPMRSGNELFISICIKCHADFTNTGTHPINVYPNRKLTNQADYSTSPDECVTCVTCHFAHASEHDYILRFRYRNGVMKAGSFANIETARAAGGCLACHASKGVLPENRKLREKFSYSL